MHLTNDRREYYRKHYLKSPHWQFVKGITLAMWPQCQACGSTERLDVHHRNYRNLYDVRPTDLVVLCRMHHAQIHAPMDDGSKASPEIVAARLHGLLPNHKENPMIAYGCLARRLFKIAVRIEAIHGVKLKGRARRLCWRPGWLSNETFSERLERAIHCNEAARKKKVDQLQVLVHRSERHTEREAGRCANPDRQRYLKLAHRMFAIARKIQHYHNVNVWKLYRKRIYGPRPDKNSRLR